MRANLDDPSVSQAMARVWEQEKEFRALIAMDWEQLGYEDAAAWVLAASWDDWYDLLNWIECAKSGKIQEWQIFPPVIDGVNTIGDRRGELYDRIRMMEQQDPDFRRWHLRQPFDRAGEREYMPAWLAYATAVWELAQQRRTEYYDQLEAERATARRNRPQPEVPAHLLPEPKAQPDKPRFRVIPHNSGFAPGVDEMQLNRLNSQLEEEELLAKLTGSGTTEPEPESQPEKPPFRVVPNHSKLAPGVESMNLNHLAAELDDELFLAKMERDRAREREQEKSQ